MNFSEVAELSPPKLMPRDTWTEALILFLHTHDPWKSFIVLILFFVSCQRSFGGVSHIDQAQMRSSLLGWSTSLETYLLLCSSKASCLPLDRGAGRICRHVPCGECSKVVPPKPVVSSASLQRIWQTQILPAVPLGLADECD